MLRPPAYHAKKTSSFFAEASRAADDSRRFVIRDQNEVLRDFLKANKDAIKEISEGEGGEMKPATRVFLCGRVKVEVPVIPEEIVPDLVCEECEKEMATVKCEACKEVFCPKCKELCHEKNWQLNLPHDHELHEMIRPLKAGDTSKVDTFRPYVLPEYELYDDELMRQRDLSVPYSLIGPSGRKIEKTSRPLIKPKYDVGARILFLDHQTDPARHVFGTIISEWDFRRGGCAPTITRGDHSVLWYVIRIDSDDLWADLSHDDDEDEVNNKLTSSNSRPSTGLISIPKAGDNMPKLEGLIDIPLRWAAQMSREVTKKARYAEYLRRYGSGKHFASLVDPSKSVANGAASAATQVSSISGGQSAESQSIDDAVSVMTEADSKATFKSKASALTVEPVRFDAAAEVMEQYGLEGKDVLHKHGQQLPAGRRSYFHVFEDTSERFSALDRSGSWNWNPRSESKTESAEEMAARAPDPALIEQMLKIVVLPEADLFAPKEFFAQQLVVKQSKFKDIITRAFVKIFAGQKAFAFFLWQEMFYKAIEMEENEAAITIQSRVRAWILRVRLFYLLSFRLFEQSDHLFFSMRAISMSSRSAGISSQMSSRDEEP
jgi:hypothetical protein